MASAVSPSASAQVLDTSNTIHAESSCFRARIISAILNRYSARAAGETFRHVLKAFVAASMACSTRLVSESPSENKPTTSDFFAGFILGNLLRSEERRVGKE